MEIINRISRRTHYTHSQGLFKLRLAPCAFPTPALDKVKEGMQRLEKYLTKRP